MATSTQARSPDRQVFLDFGKRLTETYGFSPDRELLLEACDLLDAIDRYNKTRQQKRIAVEAPKPKSATECASKKKACPLRGPDDTMRCDDCRSLQQLFGRIHAIEDVLIARQLIEREEDHQFYQAGCGVVDYTYTHIRIAIQDPIFDHLNIMEWFSPPGYTWTTVIGFFFAPFLTEEDWEGDDDE